VRFKIHQESPITDDPLPPMSDDMTTPCINHKGQTNGIPEK
jgi:hypothetical protein